VSLLRHRHARPLKDLERSDDTSAMMARRSLLGVAAALGLLVAAPAAPAHHASAASCRSATIGGQHKCIARGQYCAVRFAGQYRRYGLSCTKRDVNGRYHLQ
jgi:hypothetical protein